MVLLELTGVKQSAPSRATAPCGLQQRSSCDGPACEIFNLGLEHRNDGWMAPEVIKQSGHGRSADVWSLGATVIEMATARRPWPAFSNNLTALFQIATATEPPPCPAGAGEDLRAFLGRCLVIDPAGRATAAELLEDAFALGDEGPPA